jgi:hypothetical protein
MKLLPKISWILTLTLLFVNISCKQPAETDETTVIMTNIVDKLSSYTHYAPSKVDIMPLTEFVGPGDTQRSKINVYVGLLDQFGSQIKSPGVFRFELYEHVSRLAKGKGRRVLIWPDIDLTDPVTNNDSWLDFLRAYQFSLPCELSEKQGYILQLTCMCPNGKRLTAEFTLRNAK